MEVFKCSKEQKLSKFLLSNLKGKITYSYCLKLIRNKDVLVNGVRVKEDVILLPSQEIKVYYTPIKNELNLVYIDDNILVFDKGQNEEFDSFTQDVKKEYIEAEAVHRLDRNTSGLIIYARNQSAKIELERVLKSRDIEKHYVARVFGKMEKDSAELKDYLVKDEVKSQVKVFKTNVPNSKEIITRYTVISCDEETSLLDVELVTGRTHQIRAHLAFIGHPIVGDDKYGNFEKNKKFNAKRQKLRAYSIKFKFNDRSVLSYLNNKQIKVDYDI